MLYRFSQFQLYALTISIFLFVMIAPLFGLAINLSYEDSVYPLCIMISLVVLWIFCTLKYISTDLFNFYSLFILSAVLFNAGRVFLEIFYLNEDGILEGKFAPEILAQTLYLVALSLTCFHIGGILSVVRKRVESVSNLTKPDYPMSISTQALRIVGYLLISISIIPALLLTFDAIKIVLENNYFALFQQDIKTGMDSGIEGVKRILSGFYSVGLLFLLTGSRRRVLIRNFIFIVLFIQSCTLMFIGQRSHGSMLLMASLWVWHRTVKSFLVHKTLIIGAVVLFVLFPTIKLIRGVGGMTCFNFKYFIDAYLSIENPSIAIISEMGLSMRTIAHTLTLIPHSRPFAMGSTYAYGASTIIPNLFWDLHPSVEYGNLGHWLTMTVAPDTFFCGGGLGYSFIAEAYTNFGWVGTPLVMGLAGFLIARLTQWADKSEDYERIAVVSGCIACMLFWPRADVTIFSRDLYYYVLLPYFSFIIIRKDLNRRRMPKL